MRHCLFVLLLLTIAHSAYIYGDIYTAEGMQKLDGTAIKIKGEGFSYYFVSEKSSYSVQLPDGRYDITAEYYDDEGELVYSTSENLYLGGEDTQLDLVLKRNEDNILVFVFLGIVIVGVVIIFLTRKTGDAETVAEEPKKPRELDEEAKKVLQTIEAHEGRITQKELKEVLNYSDSKISLILAELEHEERIKRFKRGRGNIIKKVA